MTFSRPFPAGGLPDGGGGGAARVVPIHITGHRAPAAARRGRRMNERRMKTSVNTGAVSLLAVQEASRGVQTDVERGCGSEKQGLAVKKWLAQPSDERIIAKMRGETQFAQ
jgi:hypothetical protein